MNMPIAWLTLRQLLGAKRTLLLVAAALLPITLAVVFRLTDPEVEPARFIAQTLLGRLVVGTMLPLAALVVGTAALGSEIEDGTAAVAALYWHGDLQHRATVDFASSR